MKKRLAIIAALLFAANLSGCGGSSSKPEAKENTVVQPVVPPAAVSNTPVKLEVPPPASHGHDHDHGHAH